MAYTVRIVDLLAWWHEDPEWRGWLLERPRGYLLQEHVFVTWLAGFRFYEVSAGEAFDPGKRLIMRPQPDNPVDPRAVAVFDETGTSEGGHLPAMIVRSLAPREEWCGLSIMEQREDGKRIGLLIAVSFEPLEIRSVDAETEPSWAQRGMQMLRDGASRQQERIDDAREWGTADPMEQMQRMAQGLKGDPVEE